MCPVDQPDDRVAVTATPSRSCCPTPTTTTPSDVLWLVGGEETDVDAFEEAMGLDDDGEDDGDDTSA